MKKYTYEELMDLRRAGEIEVGKEIAERIKSRNSNKLLDRSGIMPIHSKCRVSNYEAKTEGQKLAKAFAVDYVNRQFAESRNFVFSGNTGTGKNHLSAAICTALIERGMSCAIITISELMAKSRECFGPSPTISEEQFIKNIVSLDLLVIDEIGLQKNTDHEKILLNRIVDQRVGNLKAIGMLTNLSGEDFKKTLGARISRRMNDNGSWISFNWESYRSLEGE